MYEDHFLKHNPEVRWFGNLVIVWLLGMAGVLAQGADYIGLVDWRAGRPFMALGAALLALASLGLILRAGTVAHVVALHQHGRPSDRAYGAVMTGKPPNTFTPGNARMFGLFSLALSGVALHYILKRSNDAWSLTFPALPELPPAITNLVASAWHSLAQLWS